MGRYAARGLALVAAALVVAGCGEAEPTPEVSTTAPAPTGSPAQPPSPAPSPSASASPMPRPTLVTPSVKSQQLSVLGTVSTRDGECLLFTPGDMAQSWVLTGDTTDLQIGTAYTIDGTLGEVQSTCNQGPVFVVVSATPQR